MDNKVKNSDLYKLYRYTITGIINWNIKCEEFEIEKILDLDTAKRMFRIKKGRFFGNTKNIDVTHITNERYNPLNTITYYSNHGWDGEVVMLKKDDNLFKNIVEMRWKEYVNERKSIIEKGDLDLARIRNLDIKIN